MEINSEYPAPFEAPQIVTALYSGRGVEVLHARLTGSYGKGQGIGDDIDVLVDAGPLTSPNFKLAQQHQAPVQDEAELILGKPVHINFQEEAWDGEGNWG